jgi:autotransporter-associated beta strand protein
VRDADVVVVGGGGGAVAAALAAKAQGAEVFLAAPRAYLGDDAAGTRELWPAFVSELSSEPLAARLFALNVPFTYTYDQTPASDHPDPGNVRLADGVRNSAADASVQFNADVQITVSCQGEGAFGGADVYFYRRADPANKPFGTVVTGVEVSPDGQTWTAVAATLTEEVIHAAADLTVCASLAFSDGTRARHLRFSCALAPGVSRQLLDEIALRTAPDDPAPGSVYHATPFKIRRNLQAALEDAGVAFLEAVPAVDVLKDAGGRVAGVVLAHRRGRQAVTARVVVDATENAWVARRAGAQTTPFVPGSYAFSRIVVADATNAPAGPGLVVQMLPGIAMPASVSGVAAPAGMPSSIEGRVYRCTFEAALASGSMAELLEVEQTARDLTWTKTVVDAADRVTWVPPDAVVGVAQETADAWPGAEALTLDAFRPAGVPGVYVLSARADMPRALAREMLNPARMIAAGTRLGAAAAQEALTAQVGEPVVTAEHTEHAEGIRESWTQEPLSANGLPVFAVCDVLVVGAGTAGAPAAIAAARAGADTVVLDVLYTMGGVQTDGRIGKYYNGNVCGFTQSDVDPGWKATGAVLYAAKAEWYRRACREAGARVLFGTLANGAIVSNGAVRGVVAVLPDGERGLIRARTVVDATGASVIAMAAGAATEFLNADELAVQGAGWAKHELGNSYANTDVAFVDDTVAEDVTYLARRVHKSLHESVWDAGGNPASRERHRIFGDVRVTPVDVLNGRTWPDTIVRARSDFDSHGFTTHDLFLIRDPGRALTWANLPLRALLPLGLEGILVTGLGISAHRDAMPILRMQPDVQNQGYAAGYAAALAAASGVSVRSVDLAQVQAHLVSVGILPAASAGTPDSFPLSAAQIQSAVEGLTNGYATLHTVLADTATALPLLRAVYAAAGDAAARLVYARVLGLLGDASGAAALAADVDARAAWDAGWNYRGMGQYGASVSGMDSAVIALGRTRATSGLSAVLAKAGLLTGTSELSHVRAAASALENLGGGSAVARLLALLAQVGGFALSPTAPAPVIPQYSDTEADAERTRVLRELFTARALRRLGDDEDGRAAAVLAAYADDPRAVYAEYARQVLAETTSAGPSDGVWVGTAATAEWNDTANWKDQARAAGAGSKATFTNAVAGPQSIALGGWQTVGSLVFDGGSRTLTDGTFDIGGASPEIAVAAGSSASFTADMLAAQPVAKSGAGRLALNGAVALGGLDVLDGTVAFSEPPGTEAHQAYSAEPMTGYRFESGSAARSWRLDFRVNRAITVTHLGVFDSEGDGFAHYKNVAIRPRSGGAALAALAFAVGVDYPLSGGYRFRHLPEPLTLQPGEYSVVAYGFTQTDGHKLAGYNGVGAEAGTLADGGGAVTFLPGAYYVYGQAAGWPTTAVSGVPASSAFSTASGSFKYVAGTADKRVEGRVSLEAGARLEVGATALHFLGGLAVAPGAAVTNAALARDVSVTVGVPAGATHALDTAALGDRADGPLTLVKSGEGRLALSGALATRGGVHVAQGTLAIDTPCALGAGGVSVATGGRVEVLGGGLFGGPVYTPNQTVSNNRSARLTVRDGAEVTFTNAFEVTRQNTYAGFCLQPEAVGGAATIRLEKARLGYLDLYLMGAGQGNGAAHHVWTGVSGGLRKLAMGHETDAGRCAVVFGAGCDFQSDYFDVAGSNAVVSLTNGATVQVNAEVRFVDGHASQLALDGGMLAFGSFGSFSGDYGVALKPILFNGTVLRALKDNDTWFTVSEASAAPLIAPGGAVFDTQPYTVALRGKGFAQGTGAAGAFVKLGGGVLRLAAPMTYTGATLVSNGTLRLDFALWRTNEVARDLLSPETEVRVSPGAALEVAGAGEGVHVQSLNSLVAAAGGTSGVRTVQAGLDVGRLEGGWTKTGDGTLALCAGPDAVPFTGALDVREGALAVRGARHAVAASLPCPGFESEPLLPDSPTNQSAMDKRGPAATGCEGWTFAQLASGREAGYQRNGSYWSTHQDVKTTNGVQTAFIRRDASMACVFTMPETANDCVLRIEYAPRCYNNTWYTNGTLTVSVDGADVETFTVTALCFVVRGVRLGRLPAGAHTLTVTGGIPAGDAETATLIDALRIEGVSEAGPASALSSEASVLSVASGASVVLDFDGVLEVGTLDIDGVRRRGGTYGEAELPGVLSGSGMLRVRSGGTRLILK